ncbi:hypothetical protein [Streptomyces sp. NPDC089795]|uniref:hypothetical protein n=1 Tax=Streptomyces sp. NPDC089795 TaxID=3155297 RepID=UPI003447372A
MRIVFIIGAASISALADFIYIRYLAKIGYRDRSIIPKFRNRGVVPLRVEIAYGFALGLSLALLNNVLPLWASLAVFLTTVVASTALAQRHHHRRAENPTTSTDGSDVP